MQDNIVQVSNDSLEKTAQVAASIKEQLDAAREVSHSAQHLSDLAGTLEVQVEKFQVADSH